MNGIKIDAERIKNVAQIWRDFNREISDDGFSKGREEIRYRIAGYLTIAYMFGAEREDGGTGLRCELCGHQPCVLFGPQPKNCERCGGEMILQAEVKEERVCEDCGHFGEGGCPVTSGGELAKATDPVVKCEKFKPRKDEKEAEKDV